MWEKEMELEEKRRASDQQHELRMLHMLRQVMHPQPYPAIHYSNHDNEYYEQ